MATAALGGACFQALRPRALWGYGASPSVCTVTTINTLLNVVGLGHSKLCRYPQEAGYSGT